MKTACVKGSHLLFQEIIKVPRFNPKMLVEGVPILTYLIQREEKELAMWVIQSGNHDLILQEPSFELPLHAAFEKENLSVASALLHQSCILPHLSSSSKGTPFQICCLKKNKMLLSLLTGCPNFDLFKAVWEDAKHVPDELFGYLFSFKNVAWNQEISSKDLLSRACEENNLNLAKYLLHHGLHGNLLRVANLICKQGHAKITELLFQSPKVLSSIRRAHPYDLLNEACRQGNPVAVQAMLIRFPNLNTWIPESRYQTPAIENALMCQSREKGQVIKVILALSPLPPPAYQFPLVNDPYLKSYIKNPVKVRKELRAEIISQGTLSLSFPSPFASSLLILLLLLPLLLLLLLPLPLLRLLPLSPPFFRPVRP